MNEVKPVMMIWNDSATQPVTVTVPSQANLLTDIGARLQARKGFSVATLNLDHVVKLARDPAFQDAYQAHSHVTADGNPIVWLSRLAGHEVSLVAGSELIVPLTALAAEHAAPVALFGSSETVLQKAAEALSRQHPGLNVVLCRAPKMGFDPAGPDAEDDIAAIRESGAQMVFVALGAPKQEVFAAHAQQHLPQTGFVSIGAGLDFIAGSQTRAPAWVRALAAEWIWRLVSNPKRLALRYGACLLVMPGLTMRALLARRKATAPR